MAFVGGAAPGKLASRQVTLRTSAQTARSGRVFSRSPASRRVGSFHRTLLHAEEEKTESKKGGDGEEEEEKTVEQTLYGIVVFVLTMALFALGLAATFARNFFPGGLAPPPS